MPLSDAQLRSLKPANRPVKLSDGGGLHVLVTPQGSRLWRLAYRFAGKQKLLALGAYPAVALGDARSRRDEAKRQLAKGLDPSTEARRDKQAKSASLANTFEIIAAEFLAKTKREGKADATLAKKQWLIGIALPDLGKRPIGEISAADVLLPLRKVEAAGNYETARRLRAVIGQVFRYAIATSKAANDPTFGLRGALVAPRVTHRAAQTTWSAFTALLRAIWGYDGSPATRAALKLMALLYPRPGELRQAEWLEFDLDVGIWTIPAVRTKMRREHRKPLSAAAVEILRDLRNHTGNRRLAFPSLHSAERPMSENTLNAALRRLGYSGDEATAHGFRATASTLLNESRRWSPDAIEVELGHVGADEVRRAYHRAVYWDERVKMAEWWAGSLESVRKSQ
ncbi:integrase arm-type DNA-binding domain-containing protein [Mesorhizobium sp. VNQ89]|uniref:tyrosine-type recombinase/integrase n=1 Tax=Mesorhizobium quangtriensis TaxID=3157709 RepID=UPI0032B863CF